MPLDRRDIERALENKLGFERTEGAKHRLFSLYVGGRLMVETRTSRGTGHRVIDDPLVTQMAKQVLVAHKFFVDLVRCTKSRSDYLQFLAKRGMIPPKATREDR